MFGESVFNVRSADDYRYINLASESQGQTLVLLHGMFGGLSNFDPLLNRIQGYPVFVPELPLYSFDCDRLSVPALAEWLNRILDDRDITRPILLGNSLGGHIALEYALTYPRCLEGLVLTGSSGLLENDLGSTRPRRYDREYVKERASLTFYEDLVDDTIVDEILDVLQSPSKLGRLLRIARSTHEHNLEHQLSGIKKPVLLVWGREDVITPPEVAETFLEKLPNAELKWIGKCGHAPMMERPEQFATYLTEFLERLNVQIANKNDDRHEKDYSHI